jgi:sodium-dependent dicarboxylate transporter 2/3/5
LIFALPATLAASCAFMLPVATPPNAIVYGSGYIRIPEMVKAGFVLNLIGIVVLSVLALIVAPAVFN